MSTHRDGNTLSNRSSHSDPFHLQAIRPAALSFCVRASICARISLLLSRSCLLLAIMTPTSDCRGASFALSLVLPSCRLSTAAFKTVWRWASSSSCVQDSDGGRDGEKAVVGGGGSGRSGTSSTACTQVRMYACLVAGWSWCQAVPHPTAEGLLDHTTDMLAQRDETHIHNHHTASPWHQPQAGCHLPSAWP